MKYALIGSRKTPSSILELMNQIVKELDTKGFTVRSGGANGADACALLAENREIYIPWARYNDMLLNERTFCPYKSEHQQIASMFHPAWDKCTEGVRKLHVRNLYIIAGASLADPVDFVVCWTPDGKDSGGTGLGIRVAKYGNIPVFNLHDPNALENLVNFIKEKQ